MKNLVLLNRICKIWVAPLSVRTGIAALFFLFLFVLNTYAGTFSVSGKVIDSRSGSGLTNVTVTAHTNIAMTSATGDYTFGSLTAGVYAVACSLTNYSFVSTNINVSTNLTGINMLGSGASNEVSVAVIRPGKDTGMLCAGFSTGSTDCCIRSGGPNLWDSAHTNTCVCHHNKYYCGPAAIKALNNHFGGTLTQEEIKWQYFEENTAAPAVSNMILRAKATHYGGTADDHRFVNLLRWALGSTNIIADTAQPSDADVRARIDAGNPMWWSITTPGSHHTLVSGYQVIDQEMQYKFLNTADNQGLIFWGASTSFAYSSSAMIPASDVSPRSTDPRIALDSDGDGVCDFDEEVRWVGVGDIDSSNADTDGDGLNDKIDIAGCLFNHGYAFFDLDGDNLRCEIDPDSDNGCVMDGHEDANANGVRDAGETSPYDDQAPDADDIPKVKITIEPYTKDINSRIFVRAGTNNLRFEFFGTNGTSSLPVFSITNSPLTCTYTPEGGSAIALPLSAATVPTNIWLSAMTNTTSTGDGEAVFNMRNGNTVVEIIQGSNFWIDTKAPTGSVSVSVMP